MTFGAFSLQDFVITMQIPSMKLDLRLVFTYGKGSTDVNGTSNGNKLKLGQVFYSMGIYFDLIE